MRKRQHDFYWVPSPPGSFGEEEKYGFYHRDDADLMVEIMREGHHPRHREVLEGFLNGELRDYGEAVEHRLRQLMKSNRPATMMEIEELKNMSYNMELRTTKGSFEGYIFAVKEGLQDVEAELRRMENRADEWTRKHAGERVREVALQPIPKMAFSWREIQKQQLPTTMACNRGIYDTIKFRREVMREMFQIEQKVRQWANFCNCGKPKNSSQCPIH
ncbi:hypothetical protein L3Y34_002155 [Caenorhabditis briggsae]|uniref:Uncharacterized protein n=1 Tax=Caenorhabditis briggsae TaxID=6238 RepID=A0AAE9DEN0_CAEBR|nr:hypothetical protein L3Y34_002155 [Caenorhabditis briggsae]